jgi:hypothetical protein
MVQKVPAKIGKHNTILIMNFKKLNLNLLTALFCLSLFISCESESEKTTSNEAIPTLQNAKLINGILHFDSKASLVQIMTNYRNNSDFQKTFDNQILELQKQGFKPLTPIFEGMSDEDVAHFVRRKLERNTKDRNFNQYLRSNPDVPVRLEDDIIFDPAYAAVLNEERKIVVVDKVYKYTEMGMFICDENKMTNLDTYLDDLTPSQKLSLMPDPNLPVPNPTPCQAPTDPRSILITTDIELLQAAPLPTCIPTWTGSGTSTPTPPSPTYAPDSDRIKSNFSMCAGGVNSLWEKVFGASVSCSYFMPNDRCVTTEFWNQYYFFFSSVGCKSYFEKKKCVRFLGMSTCWWEKSYPDKIELGVNAIQYEYNYNVPMFNAQAYNQSTTFFSFNGVNYNQFGQVIPTLPTGKGTFQFDTESSKWIMEIVVLGYQITDSNVNDAIDAIATQLVNSLPPSSSAKAQIIQKMQNDEIKYNVINAVPFGNKVKFITTDVEWASNDHRLTHYFDYNFLITWNSNMSGYGDYLSGLNGATAYTDVQADIYGSAFYSNQWGGSRLKFQ